jgi:predicted SnoaL-like aldol condensation-catalyzing enzyme
MADNKQIAKYFLDMIVAGKIDEACSKYIDMNGKHHNSYFASGFKALKEAMQENENQFPNKKFTIKYVLSEKDMVVVHSHLVIREVPGALTFHMFRIKNRKIIEMWDCGQPIQENSLNKDGPF